MARGNSKLGRRGRGREVVEQIGPGTAWSADGPVAPAAPSPGRNILPGEPFEPVATVFPAQRNPEPAPFPVTAPAGWGFAPGAPASMAGVQPEPGRAPHETSVLAWPNEEQTSPMPAVPSAGPDPLDALQQYAGLPLGAAPAPDPAQLYHPSHLTAPFPQYGEGTAAASTPTASAAPPASDSGFADGGIFTGSEPFDGIPAASPLAPPAHGLSGFGPQMPAPGYLPQSSLEPLDVTPVVPLDEVLPGEEEAGRRRGRRRAGGRRRDGAQFDDGSGSAGRKGAKRAVALLGAVAVLGAAGYVGYSQLSGTDEAVSSPTVPVKPAASAHFELPEHLATLVQITPAQAKALTANYLKLAARTSPNLPAAQTATAYHPAGSPKVAVNVVVFRPTSTSTYDALLASLSRPAHGSASVAAVPAAAGAAGGTMMCGSQRGPQTFAWCAWNSSKGMGFLQAKGTANTAYAAIYTRELRAFAER